MDKLERYLEQVCRTIGGPRALRQHLRQEMREHLLDAAAKHQVAGMSESEALDRALEEFGAPDEMRSELIAAHGERMMTLVIDRALQWKEITMKAKWLWTTWATLATAMVIMLELMFITATDMFIVPKFHKLLADGLLDPAIIHDSAWTLRFINGLHHMAEHATMGLILAVVIVGLFEWRVRSENKSFIRLSLMGSVAVALMTVVWLTGAALLIGFCVGVPSNGRMARAFAIEQIGRIETSVGEMEPALMKQDWDVISTQVVVALEAIRQLTDESAAIPSLQSSAKMISPDRLRSHIQEMREALHRAQLASTHQDSPSLEAALRQLRSTQGILRDLAGDPGH